MSEAHKGKVPWNKNKKRSEEVKRKISKTSKKRIPWNKGKKYSIELKNKLKLKRSSLDKRELSLEHRENLKTSQLKRWSKDKIKIDIPEVLKLIQENLSIHSICKKINCKPHILRSRLQDWNKTTVQELRRKIKKGVNLYESYQFKL